MDDFLIDLYALTKGAARTPREDFLSLCLGNVLRRDIRFAEVLLRRAVTERDSDGKDCARPGEREDRVRAWLAPQPKSDNSKQQIEVLTQVSAESGNYEHAGWADLRILLSGVAEQGLIFEAKVGWSVPSKEQLARYSNAKEGDIIIALVQENVRKLCQEYIPVVTWDEVATALSERSKIEWLDVDRQQLLALLAYVGVIDARRRLPSKAWSNATRANKIYEKFRPRLEKMLVALGPNDAIRQELREHVEDQRDICIATRGWGPGVARKAAYKGSFICGLTLGLDAGDHPNELVWYLEVCPSREKICERMRGREFSAWWPSKGYKGWFTTRLHISRGTGSLTQLDLEEVVRLGRQAIRTLHNGTPKSWPAPGSGVAPPAGHNESIPELRAGIRDYEAVEDALNVACCQVVAQLVSPNKPAIEAEVKRKMRGWVTDKGPKVWAGVTVDLTTIRVAILNGGDKEQTALTISLAVESEKVREVFPITIGEIKEGNGLTGPCLIAALTEKNWQSSELIPVLSRIVQRALYE